MIEMLKYIKGDRLNELACDLVRIPSINPPGNTLRCAERLLEEFERHGIKGRMVSNNEGKSNLVVEWGEGPPILLWNGHLDVVTAGKEKWEHDPFGGIIEEGILHGRGAVDMKGSIASMTEAFLAVCESGKKMKGTLKFTAVADEENLGEAGTQLLADMGELRADFAIVGEPTNLRVDVVERGVMWFDVIAHGKTSHGARPHLGVNAVEHIVEVSKAIRDRIPPLLQARSHHLVSSPCLSLTMLHGGDKINVIPDYCKMCGDRRIIPGEKYDDVIKEIEDIIEEYRTDDNRMELSVQKVVLPTEISSDHVLVQTLLRNIMKVTGEKPMIGGKDGTTDAHIINAKLGVPTVIFGPGDFSFCHRPNEYIRVEQLLQAAKIHMLTAFEILT